MGKVFIGLPVYNGENYLPNAIECLQKQSFKDFRVLISDNDSTDGTQRICRDIVENDDRFVYHRQKRNVGAAGNFNYCVKKATGTYFKWMAHDDLLQPEYLEKCVKLLETDEGAVLAHSYVAKIDTFGEVIGPYDVELGFSDPNPLVRFSRCMAMNHACVSVFGVIRLDVLKSTRVIAPFVGSDRPLLAELALHGRLESVPERLFLWRNHEERSSKRKRKERVLWFDTNAKGVSSALFVRQWKNNVSAAISVPKGFAGKVFALSQVARWSLENWRLFLKDVRILAASLVRKSLGRA